MSETRHKIGFVVDSSLVISKEYLTKENIFILPQNIVFGNQSFKEGVDITNNEFYEKLRDSKKPPETSPFSSILFYGFYRRMLLHCDKILVLTVGSNMSKTYENAINGKLELPENQQQNVVVLDSKNISSTGGLILDRMFNMYLSGMGFYEIIENTRSAIEKLVSLFYIDDINFLMETDRVKINPIKGTVAKLFGISPLMKVSNATKNTPENIGSVKRGKINEFFKTIVKQISNTQPLDISIAHIQATDYVNELTELISEHYSNSTIIFTETISPSLGAKMGFKSITTSFLAK